MTGKKFFLSIVTVLVLFFSVNAYSGQQLSLYDGEYDYIVGDYIATYAGNDIYSSFVEGSGGSGYGLIFIDPFWGAIKIVVFENDELWGWTLEGHWEGDGSTFTLARNNGTTDQRQLNIVVTMID